MGGAKPCGNEGVEVRPYGVVRKAKEDTLGGRVEHHDALALVYRDNRLGGGLDDVEQWRRAERVLHCGNVRGASPEADRKLLQHTFPRRATGESEVIRTH
ncbi:hypothetical protein D9M69_619900 [compost metagenome]